MDSLAIRTRLDALIRERGDDYASLSRLLGRNPAYVQQFVRRGVPRRLSEEDRSRLAAHFGISEASLGGPASRATAARAAGEDHVMVPILAVDASAGGGATPDGEDSAGAVAFPKSWLRSLAAGRVPDVSVIRVTGDSMEPVLVDGDDILVATDDRERLRDGIYVLRMNDALIVKRLAVHPASRRLTVRSDNPAYPTYTDVDPAVVQVIGRVVWVGRRLG